VYVLSEPMMFWVHGSSKELALTIDDGSGDRHIEYGGLY
jgi:hypothetical protein